jgi:uncharacterized membrane protein
MLCNKFIAKNIGAESDFRWRSHEITRIEGFSDAVFTFAVTLLTHLICLCSGSVKPSRFLMILHRRSLISARCFLTVGWI